MERERERERERDKNYKQKRTRYLELVEKQDPDSSKFSDAEQQELDQLVRWNIDHRTDGGGYEEWTGDKFFPIREIGNKDPIGTNTNYFGCQGGCELRILVEDHSKSDSDETKHVIKADCYHQGGNNYTCANCQKDKKDNPRDNPKDQEKDPKQEQEKPTNYLPWIFGGIGVLVVIIGLIWLMSRNNKRK